MRIVVIIPTYNESGNIERLIPDIESQFETMSHDCHILVVDDSSPDGTADVVRNLMASRSSLHLDVGEKLGLGSAYIRGMKLAMNELNADLVFEMDADYSHAPSDIPRLVAEIERGADFVIGSRYVKGGSIPREWGMLRKLISFGGNVTARFLAGMYRVRDCTAGFRAIRTSLLAKVNLDELRVQGYAFQVALLHACVSLKAKVVEIPVAFVDRELGDSKLSVKDVLEFVKNAWWIRLNSSRTFIKFAIVGATGVAVNLGSFTLLLAAGLNRYIASPIAIEVSIISNFLLNNMWTFRWRQNQSTVQVKGLKFNVVSIVSLVISYGTFVALSIAFPNVSPQFHQLVGIVPATFVNYFLNSYWTFPHAEPAGQKG